MLAKLSRALPADDSNYGYEFKWDGYRAIVYIDGATVRVTSRGGQDYSRRFPELQGLRTARLDGTVLDGEIIALGDDESSGFQRLQGRSGAGTEEAIAQGATAQPVAYMIFDLLRLGGRSTLALPYTERRSRLQQLPLEDAAWWVPPYQVGGGEAMLARSRELRREGVIAKRLASSYTRGGRTGEWLKIKNQARQELVVVGWTAGQGSRAGRIGSLLLAYSDHRGPGGRLTYAGKVGTGFTSRSLALLEEKLAPLRRPTSPLDSGSPPRHATFVEPRLVCEVEFTEWTRDGTLRHPSFKGLRDDKRADEVVRETPS